MVDPYEVFHYLYDNRQPAALAPPAVGFGVYAVFIADPHDLAAIIVPTSGILYVGMSNDLAERNHFDTESSGFESPRRSLGAILKISLRLTAVHRAFGLSETNYINYKFADLGEQKLSEWMKYHLEYASYTYKDNAQNLKKELIRLAKPPLNLNGWSNPQRHHIKELRRLCREEAKSAWLKQHG